MRYGSCPKTLDHRVKKEPHHRSRGFYSPKLEIWLEVVDWRFLKARGVPSQQDDTTSRRANAGGKETPRYAKTTPRRAAPRRTRPRSRRDRPSWSEEDAR